MSIFSGIIGKIAGSAIGGFFKSYGIWIAVGAAITAIVSMVIYIHGAEKAKALVPTLKKELKTVKADYEDKLARASAAVQACMETNEANAQEAEEQKKRADKVAEMLAEAEKEANENVGVIERESETFRQRDLDCPALDDDFREWVRDN